MKRTLSTVVAVVLGLMTLTVPARAADANRGCPEPFTRATLAEAIALALFLHPDLDPAFLVQVVTNGFNQTNLNGDAYYCYLLVKPGVVTTDNNVPGP
jgi:hypothetical protein